MTKLTVQDLIDLVASKVPDPEIRLEKVFEWAHSRHLELVKWLLALAAALFASVIVAVLKGEPSANASTWWVVLILGMAVAVTVFGLSILVRGKRVYKAHLAAQTLLGEISKISPFIERYRAEVD